MFKWGSEDLLFWHIALTFQKFHNSAWNHPNHSPCMAFFVGANASSAYYAVTGSIYNFLMATDACPPILTSPDWEPASTIDTDEPRGHHCKQIKWWVSPKHHIFGQSDSNKRNQTLSLQVQTFFLFPLLLRGSVLVLGFYTSLQWCVLIQSVWLSIQV